MVEFKTPINGEDHISEKMIAIQDQIASSMAYDPYFRVSVVSATPNPQTVSYVAMHQDYSSEMVTEKLLVNGRINWDDFSLSEAKCGNILVKRLLKHNHFGPFEHPQIIFNVGYFPHDTVMQGRTHRTGISFDVMSFRYTGQYIVDFANRGLKYRELDLITVAQAKQVDRMGQYFEHDPAFVEEVNKIFFIPPVGSYINREGVQVEVTDLDRWMMAVHSYESALKYRHYVEEKNFPEEMARRFLAMGVRQHFVVSMNLRTLLHLVCMRTAKDAQSEIRVLLDHLCYHALNWAPEVMTAALEKFYGKATIAP